MPSARAFGLDIGRKTIGVAVSDALGWTARPIHTVRRKSWAEDLAAMQKLQEQYQVSLLVVGLPMSSHGEMTEQARFNKVAAERIQASLDVPVTYVDESLSSVDADSVMQEMGFKRKKRKQDIDQQAAARILQGYLDEQHRLEKAQQSQTRQQD